jgi:hypothetical protein
MSEPPRRHQRPAEPRAHPPSPTGITGPTGPVIDADELGERRAGREAP